jgi:hypothetical protein
MTSDLSESLRFIDPKIAETYLQAHGWQLKRETDLFSRWDKSAGSVRHLFLPRSEELGDFKERMLEFVVRLSDAEDRDERQTATNVRYAAADLIRLRLSGPSVTASGELPIQEGARLFEGARHLMEAAACSAIQPRAQFGPRRPNQAKKFVKGVRLGQTERGSYVITVISDVPPPEQQSLMPDVEDPLQVPYERKVTRTLVDALTHAQKLSKQVLEQKKNVEDFESAVEAGVSSNLCDAITTIAGDSAPTDLGVAVNWAAARPVDEDQPSLVKFGPAELPVIENARDVLRQMGPFDNVEVVGSVKRLDRPAEETIGEIIIDGHAGGERRSVRVQLSDAEYHRALNAHDNRRLVSFRGTLEREGRKWILRDPGQISILDSEINESGEPGESDDSA